MCRSPERRTPSAEAGLTEDAAGADVSVSEMADAAGRRIGIRLSVLNRHRDRRFRGLLMRDMIFKMERQGLLREGDHVQVSEGLLPSSYYYTVDPSLAMSGNIPFTERLSAREGDVIAIEENDRGFYVTVRFED